MPLGVQMVTTWMSGRARIAAASVNASAPNCAGQLLARSPVLAQHRPQPHVRAGPAPAIAWAWMSGDVAGADDAEADLLAPWPGISAQAGARRAPVVAERGAGQAQRPAALVDDKLTTQASTVM